MSDIVEHILSNAERNGKFSEKSVLESFFDSLLFDVDDWPMAEVLPQAKVSYIEANIEEDKFCMANSLNMVAKFKTKNSEYLIAEKLTYDGGVEFELDSVFRERQASEQKENFVYEFIQKHYDLLKNLVKKMGIISSEAVVKVHAHSGLVNNIKTRGAYVWATCGFDFANPVELRIAKNAFQRFAQKYGIEISDKDLKLFKYPCHFAAFRTNKKVDGQDVGKAFMMQYDWQGILSAELKKNSELFKYGWLYHKQGKSIAENGLSKSFRTMMKKYNQEQKQFNSLKKVFKAKKAFRR